MSRREAHGEFKVSQGKLVVVDLVIEDELLSQVRISGDFFLEPEEALHRLGQAVQSLPITASAGEFEAALQGAVGDAVLVGFAPRDIAIAILRALGRSSSWADHEFTLIETGPQHPHMQMALDEVIATEVAAGSRGPSLRIWEWASNAVIIGSFQSVANEVDLEAAARHNTTVVRRISGGGAMFVEPGNTITYSLYVPATLVEGMSFVESYAFLDAWVVRAFRELGVEASYVPINDIVSPGGKIGGAAQKRLAQGAVLHHVTMAYDMDATKMMDILRIGREKLSDKGHISAGKRVDPIRSQTGLSRDEVVTSLLGSFEASYGLSHEEVGPQTLAAAEQLAQNKYSSQDWLHRVP